MRTFLTAVCLITGWIVPVSADACSCQAQSVSEARAAAGAIFEGRVASVQTTVPSGAGATAALNVTIEVDRMWKGVSTHTVTVQTPSNGAICGYPFRKGGDYLVYANADEDGGLRVSLCSRTKRVATAKADHKFLGEEAETFRGGNNVREKNSHAAAALSDRCTIGVRGDATPSGMVALLLFGAICARRAR